MAVATSAFIALSGSTFNCRPSEASRNENSPICASAKATPQPMRDV